MASVPPAGVASVTPPAPSTADLGPSPVPPAPKIPDLPAPVTTSSTKLPRMLKATYMTQGEKLLWETRPTRWFFLPLPTLILILVIAFDAMIYRTITGAFASLVPPLPTFFGQPVAGSSLAQTYEIVGIVLLLVAILYFGVRWLRYASIVYVVTSTRVIRQKGILGKEFDEVQLLQVRGVDVTQKIWQRLLGYGTARVSAEFGGTAQAMGNEEWPGVPHPIKFEQTIEEAQQRIRGLIPPLK